MKQKTVCIFGGSGFLGGYIVSALLRSGYNVKIVSRNSRKAEQLKTSGSVGQLAVVEGNIRDEPSVEAAVKGCDIVINAVGILFEGGSQKFNEIHALSAERIAKVSKENGVERLIHISALGVDKPVKSDYIRTKMRGEKAVLAAFPEATILRPSVIFGREDNFFNQFAQMAMISPFLPLIDGGKTKFQPIYVGDVADAVTACLEDPETEGKIYELGGPVIYSFREILEYILETINRKKLFIYLPFPLAEFMGAILGILPKPPLTRDQVRLLKSHNIVEGDEKTIFDLDIKPRKIEDIVPEYLDRYVKK